MQASPHLARYGLRPEELARAYDGGKARTSHLAPGLVRSPKRSKLSTSSGGRASRRGRRRGTNRTSTSIMTTTAPTTVLTGWITGSIQ